MIAVQTDPFAFFIVGIDRDVFPASQFFLERREVNQLQAIRLRCPDRVALRIFAEQAKGFCWREIVSHGTSVSSPILALRRDCRQ